MSTQVIFSPLAASTVFSTIQANPNSLVTDGVTTTATLSSAIAETKVVTANSGTMQVSQSVVFLPGTPSGSTCTFVANPNLLTADNTAASVLTFAALDAFGNAVPNTPVSLAVTGSNNALTPVSGNTDAAGVFTATLTSGNAETKVVTATAPGGINLAQIPLPKASRTMAVN